MAKAYKKTAKDLAFDRERAKLRRQIRDLQQEVREVNDEAAKLALAINSQNEAIEQLHEENRKLRELTGLSPEAIEIILNDAKRTAEASEHIKSLLSLSKRLGAY